MPEEQHGSHTARHLCSLALGHPAPDTTPCQQSNTALAKTSWSTPYFLFCSSLFDLISTHRTSYSIARSWAGCAEHTTAGTAIHVVLIGFPEEIPRVFPVKEADIPCGLQTSKACVLDQSWYSKSRESKGAVNWGLKLYRQMVYRVNQEAVGWHLCGCHVDVPRKVTVTEQLANGALLVTEDCQNSVSQIYSEFLRTKII